MTDKIKDFQVVLTGIIIALSLVVCAKIIASNVSNAGLAVTGTAFEIVTSDTAVWRIEITAANPVKTAAYNKLTADCPRVKEFLVKNGVNDSEIEVENLNSYASNKINDKTGYSTNEVYMYNFSQTFKITSSNVDKIKSLSNEIYGLTDSGINIASYPPSFTYSKINDIKLKLLEAATMDAKNRAINMLRATNNHVGAIKSARMGVFQITAPESNDVSDYGNNDTASIKKKVTAVSNVVFSVK